jgi:F0F1-type ATP synthase assembly protein I
MVIYDREAVRKAAQAFAAVTEVIVFSLSGFAAGYFLDRWIQKTSPWLTVLFSFLGLIGGFYRLYKVVARDGDGKEKH